MSEDSNGTPPDESSNGASPDEPPEPLDVKEAERLVREALERGEDPFPIVRRVVLETIDKLASRVQRGPGEDPSPDET